MQALRAFLGGLLGLVLGAVGAAIISNVIMGWAGVSDFEGGRGMAAAFVFGPLGGLIGLGLGIWLGLRIGRRRAPAGGPGAAISSGTARSGTARSGTARSGTAGSAAAQEGRGHTLRSVVIAIAGIVALAGVIVAIQYYSVPHHLEYDQSNASLAFELRAPAAMAGTLDRTAIEISLDTDLNQQPGSWADAPARIEDDWAMLSGEVELYYRTAQRLLVIKFPGGRDLIFDPDLPAKPDPDAGWSDWRKADFVGLPGQAQTVKPGPDDPYELRYRVKVWGME